ncbi:MAG: hypothetical protein ACOX8E_11775, partial [Ruminococcus sp.]
SILTLSTVIMHLAFYNKKCYNKQELSIITNRRVGLKEPALLYGENQKRKGRDDDEQKRAL